MDRVKPKVSAEKLEVDIKKKAATESTRMCKITAMKYNAKCEENLSRL